VQSYFTLPEEPFEDEDFLSRVEQRLIDGRFGVIEWLDEGDLIQLPVNQCAASWRWPSGSGGRWCTTDSGATFQQARVQVVCRVLEQYMTRLLEESPKHRFVSVYLPGAGGAVKRIAMQDLAGGCVVSGTSGAQLVSSAAGWAIASRSASLPEWVEFIPDPVDLEPDGRQMWNYLADIGELKNFRFQRNELLLRSGCTVIKAFYEEGLVSVVSGTPAAEVYRIALYDVWLRLTAVSDFDDLAHLPRSPEVRSRGVGITPELVRRISSVLGIAIGIAPVSANVTRVVEPLRFAYSAVLSGWKSAKTQAAPAPRGPGLWPDEFTSSETC
jgi:hypothetical protein